MVLGFNEALSACRKRKHKTKRTCIWLFPVNGVLPVTSWNNMAPTLQRSACICNSVNRMKFAYITALLFLSFKTYNKLKNNGNA